MIISVGATQEEALMSKGRTGKNNDKTLKTCLRNCWNISGISTSCFDL